MDTRKVALVTGAGSGIGRAVALALLDHGYAVVLAGRREDKLREAARASAASERALPIAADVREPDSVNALFRRAAETFGRLDLLFNNAGVLSTPMPLDEVPIEAWRTAVDTNVTGAFLCAQAAFRQMKAQRPQGGRIVNNGSVSAHAPRPHTVAYATTKHAITGLTKALSLEGRAYDIACGQIDIGNVVTDLGIDMTRGMLQADGTMRPEPVMSLDAVTQAVLYMAGLPLEANVQFITVMATKMPLVGRG